jgi:hypothetical protein
VISPKPLALASDVLSDGLDHPRFIQTQGALMTTPEVAGFDQAPFIHQGRTHQVYRAGAGPAVIVIHEIPGIHPGMVSFAQRLLAAGYTVYRPCCVAPTQGGLKS